MATKSGDRTANWPAIEKKHGLPIEHWLSLLEESDATKYDEQMALLQEGHGFSRAHANAVVMYARGSTTTKRFGTLDDYLKGADPVADRTVRAILGAIQKRYPELELVLAWNQPMLRCEAGYVFGISLGKRHILLLPAGTGILDAFADRLTGLKANKKTVQVPFDWDVDVALLQDMAGARLAELGASS